MSFWYGLADGLWNPWLLGLVLGVGLWLSISSGWFALFELPLWLGQTAGQLFRREKGDGVSPAQALCTALAATIGTGSIAGVATALCLGGPGAIFWMWVSALLGLMTSFVEKYLAVRYRRPAPGGGYLGGPMYYLRDGLGSPLLAGWFALAALPATLTGGNLAQSGAIAAALETGLGLPPLWVGCATALVVGLVMAGGLGRIARAASLLVPAMAVLYLGGGLAVLAVHADRIPGALALIVGEALAPGAVLGGGAGYSLSAALRYGVARGVFTNEAGLGTSAMAHGAARTDSPVCQGFWGMLEVLIATPVVCTLTALVVLVTGVYDPHDTLSRLALGPLPPQSTGVPLVARGFGAVLGDWGPGLVALCLVLFALSSLLGWSYYGQQCLNYLPGGNRLLPLYRVAFLGCIVAGAVWDTTGTWQLVDLCSALMAVPNLAGVLLLSPQALGALNRWRSHVTPNGRI